MEGFDFKQALSILTGPGGAFAVLIFLVYKINAYFTKELDRRNERESQQEERLIKLHETTVETLAKFSQVSEKLISKIDHCDAKGHREAR